MNNVTQRRDKLPYCEKLAINLGYVDMGRIDLLVQDGFYSNRSDMIRTAIRNQLDSHAEVVSNALERHTMELGMRDYIRTIVFHGTADATVHPSNGEGIVQHVIAKDTGQTIETIEHGQAGGRSFACRISSPVNGAATLESWSVDGLGHHWSGGQPEGSYTDPKGPDASAEMIRFFFDTSDKEL